MSLIRKIKISAAAVAPSVVLLIAILALHAFKPKRCADRIDLALTGPQLPLCKVASITGSK